MDKMTAIATCLTETRFSGSIKDGHLLVKREFARNFKDKDFDAWNSELSDDVAQSFIDLSLKRKNGIQVKELIVGLWLK